MRSSSATRRATESESREGSVAAWRATTVTSPSTSACPTSRRRSRGPRPSAGPAGWGPTRSREPTSRSATSRIRRVIWWDSSERSRPEGTGAGARVAWYKRPTCEWKLGYGEPALAAYGARLRRNRLCHRDVAPRGWGERGWPGRAVVQRARQCRAGVRDRAAFPGADDASRSQRADGRHKDRGCAGRPPVSQREAGNGLPRSPWAGRTEVRPAPGALHAPGPPEHEGLRPADPA